MQPAAEVQAVTTQLRRLYPDDVPDFGVLTTFVLKSREHSHWLSIDKLAAAVAGNDDVYFAVGLGPRGAGLGPRNRATESEIVGIPGVWADIDISDPVHSKSNLPSTISGALDIASSLGLKPSMVIETGHGIQAYWIFKEFLRFETDEDRVRGLTLARDWQESLRQWAISSRGWTIDSTADGARVFRLAGTWNAKVPGDRKPAKVLYVNGPDYDERVVMDACTYRGDPVVIGAKKTVGPASPVAGGFIWDGLEFSAGRRLDPNIVQALMDNSESFGPAYNLRRWSGKDKSPSGAIMVACNEAAKAGVDRQGLVDLQIEIKEKHNLSLSFNEKKWAYATTADKALANAVSADQPKRIRPENAASSKVAAFAESEASENREETLGFLSDILKCEVVGWKQYGTREPTFSLVIIHEGGEKEIPIGSDREIMQAATFERRLLSEIKTCPEQMPRGKNYKKFLMLLQSVRDHAPEIDDAEYDTVSSWCHAVLGDDGLTDPEDWEDAAIRCAPFRRDGFAWFTVEGFRRYLHRHGNNISDKAITARLKQVGFVKHIVAVKLDYGRSTRNYWKIPEAFLAGAGNEESESSDRPAGLREDNAPVPVGGGGGEEVRGGQGPDYFDDQGGGSGGEIQGAEYTGVVH